MLHLVKPLRRRACWRWLCQRALAHDSPYYRTVKTILATGADLRPEATPETPSGYAAKPRFARDAASLFASPNPQQDLLH